MREKFRERNADGGERFRQERISREPGQCVGLEIIDTLRCDNEVASRIMAQAESTVHHLRRPSEAPQRRRGEVAGAYFARFSGILRRVEKKSPSGGIISIDGSA